MFPHRSPHILESTLMSNRARRFATAATAASVRLESLEDRQMFAAVGTMNVIDAGNGPSLIVNYSLNDAADFADAGVFQWARSAANPGTYAGRPTPGQPFSTFCLEPDQEFPSGAKIGRA